MVCFTCVDQNQNMLCDELEIPGCTNQDAINYNADATDDDGSCEFATIGCTDPLACNYNPDANEDASYTSCATLILPPILLTGFLTVGTALVLVLPTE